MQNQQAQRMAEADAALAKAVAALADAKGSSNQALSDDVTRLLIEARVLRATSEGPKALFALHQRAATGFLLADWAATVAGLEKAGRSALRRRSFLLAAQSDGDTRLLIEIKRILRDAGLRIPEKRVHEALRDAYARAEVVVSSVGTDMPALVRQLEQPDRREPNERR